MRGIESPVSPPLPPPRATMRRTPRGSDACTPGSAHAPARATAMPRSPPRGDVCGAAHDLRVIGRRGVRPLLLGEGDDEPGVGTARPGGVVRPAARVRDLQARPLPPPGDA